MRTLKVITRYDKEYIIESPSKFAYPLEIHLKKKKKNILFSFEFGLLYRLLFFFNF